MQETEISVQDLILSLLKADIINSKLISGLESIGLTMEDFYIDLCFPVLKLMGFIENDRDELNTMYLNTLDRLIQNNLADFHSRKNSLALEFYTELLAEKKRRENLVRIKNKLRFNDRAS